MWQVFVYTLHLYMYWLNIWLWFLWCAYFHFFLLLQALEAKLATCRNFVKDQPRSGKIGGNSPMNSPRYAVIIFSVWYQVSVTHYLRVKLCKGAKAKGGVGCNKTMWGRNSQIRYVCTRRARLLFSAKCTRLFYLLQGSYEFYTGTRFMLPSELVLLNPCSKDMEVNRFTLEQGQFQSHFGGDPIVSLCCWNGGRVGGVCGRAGGGVASVTSSVLIWYASTCTRGCDVCVIL